MNEYALRVGSDVYYPGTRNGQKLKGNRSLTLAKENCSINASYLKPNSQLQSYNSIDFSYEHQRSQQENVNHTIVSTCYLEGSLCLERHSSPCFFIYEFAIGQMMTLKHERGS